MLLLAVAKFVEFDDKTILRKGDTRTNINGFDHACIEVVAIVRFDFEVVTFFLEAIADTWVEDSNILLLGISRP